MAGRSDFGFVGDRHVPRRSVYFFRQLAEVDRPWIVQQVAIQEEICCHGRQLVRVAKKGH